MTASGATIDLYCDNKENEMSDNEFHSSALVDGLRHMEHNTADLAAATIEQQDREIERLRRNESLVDVLAESMAEVKVIADGHESPNTLKGIVDHSLEALRQATENKERQKPLIDRLLLDLKHTRTSCSDEESNGNEFPNSGGHPRCTRCLLLYYKKHGRFPYHARVNQVDFQITPTTYTD